MINNSVQKMPFIGRLEKYFKTIEDCALFSDIAVNILIIFVFRHHLAEDKNIWNMGLT